ncbi:MAG: FecR family protein [Proteobacteria bacterium]|nr:hypothetical protein [Desulfobulbaceae bacterium]MBU4151386.1 FecR family protein [Pseudomonadota bacterium]
MIRLLFLIAALAGILFDVAGAFAVSPDSAAIATVVAVRGQVTATTPHGVVRTLVIKGPVFEEDILRTGKQGRIQLLFRDASIISLASDTEMILAEYHWDQEAKTGKMKTRVKEGTFRVMGGALTKFVPQNFTTETPTATIGIRGSMYAGTVRGNSLSVVFQGGKGIDITNAAGTVAITTPGFGSQVSSTDQPPSPPKKLSGAELGIFNETMTGTPPEEKQTGKSDQEKTPMKKKREVGDKTPAGKKEMNEAPSASSTALASEMALKDLSGQELGVDSVPPQLTTALPVPVPVPPVLYEPKDNPDNLPVILPPAVPVPPRDGISGYKGTFKGISTPDLGAIGGDFLMEVNWHSGKAVGGMKDQTTPYGGPVFFFGTVKDANLTDIHIFGSDAGDPPSSTIPTSLTDGVSLLSGAGTGGFAGTQVESFTASATGGEYSLRIPGTPLVSQWEVTVSAARGPQDPLDLTSLKGTSLWSGFAVGVSENVNGPDVERKLFMNTVADGIDEEFILAIDRDLGTITGRFKAPQLNRMSTATSSTTTLGSVIGSNFGGLELEIGGSHGSAYVLDDAMMAIIGCSGNCINDDSTSTPVFNVGLTPYGNYLVTEVPERQFSDYVSWGHWEITHQEPDGPDMVDTVDDMYHTHVPYSLWIAGQRTPASFVDSLLNKTTFVGHYSGRAQGQVIDSMNHASPLTNGRTNLAIDFGQASVVSAVTGALSFDEVTLSINSAASLLTGQGFKASIVNPGVIDSAVNGVFYGPTVNAIGGNFQAELSTQRYLGIFGGNLVNGPAR